MLQICFEKRAKSESVEPIDCHVGNALPVVRLESDRREEMSYRPPS
jgi:hypothetical protein